MEKLQTEERPFFFFFFFFLLFTFGNDGNLFGCTKIGIFSTGKITFHAGKNIRKNMSVTPLTLPLPLPCLGKSQVIILAMIRNFDNFTGPQYWVISSSRTVSTNENSGRIRALSRYSMIVYRSHNNENDHLSRPWSAVPFGVAHSVQVTIEVTPPPQLNMMNKSRKIMKKFRT